MSANVRRKRAANWNAGAVGCVAMGRTVGRRLILLFGGLNLMALTLQDFGGQFSPSTITFNIADLNAKLEAAGLPKWDDPRNAIEPFFLDIVEAFLFNTD